MNMSNHSYKSQTGEASPHPWEAETTVSKPMYRCETTSGGVVYVVANGFDDAVRKVHHHHWQHGQWPVVFTDPITENLSYDQVRKVELFHPVIL